MKHTKFRLMTNLRPVCTVCTANCSKSSCCSSLLLLVWSISRGCWAHVRSSWYHLHVPADLLRQSASIPHDTRLWPWPSQLLLLPACIPETRHCGCLVACANDCARMSGSACRMDSWLCMAAMTASRPLVTPGSCQQPTGRGSRWQQVVSLCAFAHRNCHIWTMLWLHFCQVAVQPEGCLLTVWRQLALSLWT